MRLFRLLLVASLIGAAGLPSVARAQTVVLQGETGAPKTFALADLAALPQTEVKVTEDDSSVVIFRGPLLRDVVTQIGAPEGRALRGPSMAIGILAESPDRYTVAFTLGEIDPQFGAKLVIVALSQNGQPLSARDGPFRIIVAGESFRARWVRNLSRVTLVHLSRPQ